MAQEHPHAEAVYNVVALEGGVFGVEVTIPQAYPTMVSGFASREAADAWVAKHKQGVQSKSSLGRGSQWRGRAAKP